MAQRQRTVTLSGTAAAINTALASSELHRQQRLLWQRHADGDDDGRRGWSSGAQTFAITVADTAAISETLTGTLSGSENAAISLAGYRCGSPNPSDTLTTTLTVTNGTITAGGAADDSATAAAR